MKKINKNAVLVIILSSLLIIITIVIVIKKINNNILSNNINSEYTFQKLEYNTSNIKLNNMKYDVLFNEDSLIINNKKLNVSDNNISLYAYIWYDIIIVVEKCKNDIPRIYAYDKYLNTLGQISNDYIGSYNSNDIFKLYSFNEKEIIIKEINKPFLEANDISNLNCNNMENVYIEKETIYNYSFGKLSNPRTKITKMLFDIACNE